MAKAKAKAKAAPKAKAKKKAPAKKAAVKKAPAGKAAAKKPKIEVSDLVVKSKVKELIKEAGMNASAEIWMELGHTVSRSVKIAIERAKSNKRKTVKGCDI